jgi:hypothetical protein
MISYADIPAEPQPEWVEHVPGVGVPPVNTECNYLVMFFVIGVFFMGIVDGIRT